MDNIYFESALKNIIGESMEAFNNANFDQLNERLDKNIVFTSEEIVTKEYSTPLVRLFGNKAVVEYWMGLREQYDNKVDEYKILSIGKRTVLRCFYHTLELAVDSEIVYNEYGKIKIFHNRLAPVGIYEKQYSEMRCVLN